MRNSNLTPRIGILALIFLQPAAAVANEAFSGKTIRIFVGSGAGGVYDIFARLAGRHIGKHLPGHPTVLAVNMPGAGSITAANYVFNIAPKDGTSLGLMSPSVKVMEAFAGARFKAAEFNWIGRIISTANVTFTFGKDAPRSIQEARTREIAIAATAPSSPLSFFTRVLNETGGTKFKMVHGYIDANAAILALERGEVQGATVSWNSLKSMRPHWVKDGKVNILVQYTMTPHTELSNIPTAISLATNDNNKALLELFMNAAVVGLALMAPPNTPQERIDLLRKAFKEMMNDPAFKADSAKLDPDMDPLDGWSLQKAVNLTNGLPPSLMERAKSIATNK